MDGKKKGLIVTIIILAVCLVLAIITVGTILVVKGNRMAAEEVDYEERDGDEEVEELEKEAEEEIQESEFEKETEEVVEEEVTTPDRDMVLAKFVGFWVWDNEANIMGYCLNSGCNGLDITACGKGGAVYGDEEAEYEYLITRGPVWTDNDLVDFSENELVFVDDYGVQYNLVYLDERRIQLSTDGGIPEVAINSAYLDDTGYDLEGEIEQIQTWYYDTQGKIEQLKCVSQDAYVDFFYDGVDLVKIAVKGGYDGWNMAREYYFHDGQLYFMFAYDDMGEHRIYIKENIMIRYIDWEGIYYDIGYGMPEEAWEVSEKGFEEVMEIQ